MPFLCCICCCCWYKYLRKIMSDWAKPVLGYWDMRGIAQPIRLLLVVAEVDFEDKVYRFCTEESADIELYWREDKSALGLDFPDLPFWIDQEVKLTQPLAIIKYLARQYDLIAKDNVTLARQEMLELQLRDYQTAFTDLVYSKSYQDVKDNYKNVTLVEQLDALNTYLGDNHWFSAEFSYVDILAYDLLDWCRMYSPSTFQNYSKLSLFMSRFEAMPRIYRYQNSNKYQKWPIFSPGANWGFE